MGIKRSKTCLLQEKIQALYKDAQQTNRSYQGSFDFCTWMSFKQINSAVVVFITTCLFIQTSCAAGGMIENVASDLPLLPIASHFEHSETLTCPQSSSTTLHMDFDGRVSLMPSPDNQQLRFIGQDSFTGCAGKTKSDSNYRPTLNWPGIQFQGGDESMRFATISSDPQNKENKTLLFGLRAPNVTTNNQSRFKGRVQMNIYRNTDVRQLKMSVRMFLHADMEFVRSFPGVVNWLTVSEWWNNADWTGENYPFRISVNLVKENAGRHSPLLFQVKSETLDRKTQRWSKTIWKQTADNFVVPTGRWINLEYVYKEGDASHGLFFMAATVEGGKRAVLFDIANFTHHPEDRSPNGLTHFNPLKLYTSGRLIDHVRENGGFMQIYWDDLNLIACSEGKQRTCNIN